MSGFDDPVLARLADPKPILGATHPDQRIRLLLALIDGVMNREPDEKHAALVRHAALEIADLPADGLSQ